MRTARRFSQGLFAALILALLAPGVSAQSTID